MKAIVWTQYGSPEVLQLRDIEKPSPKDNEVLIRVCATTATTGDSEMRGLSGLFWYTLLMRAYIGFRAPRRLTILGMELAGVIESVGKDITRFKPGDQVFAATGFVSLGTYTEYKCLTETPEGGALAIKPANMSFEEAAAVPVGGLEALHFLRLGHVQRGHEVLINGAGGTIGTFAVQLAKNIGAEVTAVDRTEKLDMLRSIGADHVIDYTREDFTKSGRTYDVVLDMIGRSPFSGCLKSLKQNGRYLFANPRLSQMVRGRWASMTGSKKIIFGTVRPTSEDLMFLTGLIEADKLKSVIDRRYPLEQIADAHRYVDTGQKRGHVVITV